MLCRKPIVVRRMLGTCAFFGKIVTPCRMSRTSKSPRKVAMVALHIGERSLPIHAHRYSPKTFTQPQLFTCLVLKAFFKTDYRGIVAYLNDMTELRETIGLKKVPLEEKRDAYQGEAIESVEDWALEGGAEAVSPENLVMPMPQGLTFLGRNAVTS